MTDVPECKQFKVMWGICGDYDDIEKYFKTESEAMNYYNETLSEEKDIWIEVSKTLQFRSCS